MRLKLFKNSKKRQTQSKNKVFLKKYVLINELQYLKMPNNNYDLYYLKKLFYDILI